MRMCDYSLNLYGTLQLHECKNSCVILAEVARIQVLLMAVIVAGWIMGFEC